MNRHRYLNDPFFIRYTRRWLKFTGIVLGFFLFVGLVTSWIPINIKYSEGQRTGVVTKISRKGLALKSWEGEMNVGGASAAGGGTMIPVTWEFSVKDIDLVERIQTVAGTGNRVTLMYREVLSSGARYETSYFITDVLFTAPGSTQTP